MEQNEKSFSYVYSAEEHAELERIRRQYLPRQETKLERLRRLDRIPHNKVQIWALPLGIVGVLILGCGMSLCMSEFSHILGPWEAYAMVIGIAVGIVGLVLVALAYPIYNHVLQKYRDRLGPEILQLADELMNGQ